MSRIFDDPHNWDKEVISMDNHRKYEYKANPKEYSVQTISTDPGDIILVHVSEDLDLDSVNTIYGELTKAFPNNSVLIANDYILQGLTIIKPATGKVNEYYRREESDILDDWLRKNVEYTL